MKKILLICGMLLHLLSVNADNVGLEFSDELFTYRESYIMNVSRGNGVFVKAKDPQTLSGDIVIPSHVTYQGKSYPVIRVDACGFSETKITSVELPKTLLEIGDDAFWNCPNLEKVVLSSRIYRIRACAFRGCKRLKTIESHMYYPSPIIEEPYMKESGVTPTIYVPKGSLAFYQSEEGWKKMSTTFIEKDEIEQDTTLLSYEILNDRNVVVYPYSKNIRGKVEIPSEVTIGSHKYTVVSMGSFINCRRVVEIKLSETIKEISSFKNCESLKSLYIPRSVGADEVWGITYDAIVSGCNKLEEIIVEEGSKSYKVDGNALLSFDGTIMCGYMAGRTDKEYAIPDGVTCLVEELFKDNDKLQKITVPSGVTVIPHYCFYNAKSLQNVTLKGPVTTIRQWAFAESGITSFTIPQTVEMIENEAFFCYNLKILTSKMVKPINILNDVFSKSIYDNAILYVPTGRSSYYKSTSGWSQFIHIEEKDMSDVIYDDNPFDNIQENQMVMGYYIADSFDDYVSWDKTPGTYEFLYPIGYAPAGQYKMCISFTKEDLASYVGNAIKHMRFALSNTRNLSNVAFWIGRSKEEESIYHLYYQPVSNLQEGWNVVTLDTPFELSDDLDSIFIGIDYYQEGWNAPIPLHQIVPGIPMKGAGYMYGSYKGTKGMWVNVGEVLPYYVPIQCLIEGDHIPQYDIRMIHSVSNRYFKTGENVNGEVYLQNWGKMSPDEIFELVCIIDGKEIAKNSIARGGSGLEPSRKPFGMPIGGKIPKDTPSGEYDMKVAVSSIMDKAPEYTAGDTIAVKIKIYNHDMGRQRSLIECHQTFSCGNTASTDEDALKMIGDGSHYILLNEHFDDELECEASRAYLVEDTITGRQTIFFINRWVDEYVYRDYNTLPSFADVHISSSYDESQHMLHIKVKGTRNEDFLPVEKWANLTVLLSEDNVVYPTYNDLTGKWEESYRHNALLRTNVSAIWGDPIDWVGDNYEMNYQIRLKDDWVKDNMHIIAFISKPFNGKNRNELNLINCNIFDVKDSKAVTAIDNVINRYDNDEYKAEDIYTLQGRKVHSKTSLPSGMYFINGKKVVIR